MLRKVLWVKLAALLAVMMVLAGCSAKPSAKELLQRAAEKSAQIESFAFSGSLKLDELDVPMEDIPAEQAQQIANLMKSAELSWKGAYRADPMLAEITLNIAIKGDMEINFSLPIVINAEKIWIKVPNIPMLPLPPDLVDKFVEIDLRQLAEEQGTTIPDFAVLMKLTQELNNLVFKHLDEETFLSTPKKSEADLPENADVKDVVKLTITKEQVKPLIETFVKKIGPEAIELLSKDEYREPLGLEQSELEAVKEQLASYSESELAKELESFESEVDTFDVTALLGINRNGFISYADFGLRVTGRDQNGNAGKIGLKLVMEQTNINGDVTFEYGEPNDVLTLEDLTEMFQSETDLSM